MNLLIARSPPLPIEVARHREGLVIRRTNAFALFEHLFWRAPPIEARELIIVLFNVAAVAKHVVCDQPLTTDVAPDFYGVRTIAVVKALAVCGYIVWIPPIGQFSATVNTIDIPIYAIVVFVGVRAGGDAVVIIEVPAPAIGPAMVMAHSVQVFAPAQRILFL